MGVVREEWMMELPPETQLSQSMCQLCVLCAHLLCGARPRIMPAGWCSEFFFTSGANICQLLCCADVLCAGIYVAACFIVCHVLNERCHDHS